MIGQTMNETMVGMKTPPGRRFDRRVRSFVDGLWTTRFYRNRLPRQPVFVDVGSAGGASWRWRRAIQKGLVRGITVDPVEDSSPDHIPFALGDRNEERPFYKTAFPDCSSCRMPNESVLRHYPVGELFQVKETVNVQLRRADSVWSERNLPTPDFLSVDVQGFEREVLEGFGHLLDTVLAVETEVHLREIYRGETLFASMFDFMDEQGFYLRHFQPQSPFEGELLEANAFWVRRSADKELIKFWERLNTLPPRAHYADW